MLICRYHGDWRSETQSVVSLLAFMHWLETESLLLHAEAEEKLGCMLQFPHLLLTRREAQTSFDAFHVLHCLNKARICFGN